MSSTVRISPQNPPLKRTLEEMNDPRPVKKAAHDLEPLFDKLVGNLVSIPNEKPLTHRELVDLLSYDEEVMFTLQQVPIEKIKQAFKKLLQQSQENMPFKKQIWHILKDLYPIALFNSSYTEQLKKTIQELPKIKDKVSDSAFKELRTLLREGRHLRKQAENCTSLQKANELLPQIEQLIIKLEEFRRLKQYQDKEVNQRLLVVSKYVEQQRAPQQYPELASEFLPAVKDIAPHSQDLLGASRLIQQLVTEKSKLLKIKSSSMDVQSLVNPLETRFLKAFAVPFYEAFAKNFWTLLWNSKDDPEIQKLMQELPGAELIKPEKVSIEHISILFGLYLPNSDFEEWMLKALSSIDPMSLNSLEKSLQEKTKAINEIHENQQLNSELKKQLKLPYQNQMVDLCLSATKPSFTTLSELKLFLTE